MFEVHIVLFLNHYIFEGILRMDVQIVDTRSPRELNFVPLLIYLFVLSVKLLAPKILRWLLNFLKISVPYYKQ